VRLPRVGYTLLPCYLVPADRDRPLHGDDVDKSSPFHSVIRCDIKFLDIEGGNFSLEYTPHTNIDWMSD